MVCGCSSARKVSSWRASARRMLSNGISASVAPSRSMISSARSAPTLSASSSLGQVEAAAAEFVRGGQRAVRLGQHGRGVGGGDSLQPHDLRGEVLDHLARAAGTSPWRRVSRPSCTSRIGGLAHAGERCRGRRRPRLSLPLREPALDDLRRSPRAGCPRAWRPRRASGPGRGRLGGGIVVVRRSRVMAPMRPPGQAGAVRGAEQQALARAGRLATASTTGARLAAPASSRNSATIRTSRPSPAFLPRSMYCAVLRPPSAARRAPWRRRSARWCRTAARTTWTASPRRGSSPTALATSAGPAVGSTAPRSCRVQHDRHGQPLAPRRGRPVRCSTTLPTALSTVRCSLT